MCGNDISIVDMPSDGLIEQLRTQAAYGSISIKNNYNSQSQKFSLPQLSMLKKIDISKVKCLELIRCGITHQLLDELLKINWSNLQVLSLNHNKIGPIGCRHIADCTHLANLKTLQLANNKIKDMGAKAFLLSKFLQLEEINLDDNQLTNDAIRNLNTFPELQYISLSGNSLDDQSVNTIKDINSKGLSFLAISRNNFTNMSLDRLLNIKRLEVLLIDRNKISMSKQQLPKSEVYVSL